MFLEPSVVQTGKTPVFIGRPNRNGHNANSRQTDAGANTNTIDPRGRAPTGVERSADTPHNDDFETKAITHDYSNTWPSRPGPRREASGKGPPPYAVSGLAVLLVPPKTSSRRESSDGLGGTCSTASPDIAEGAPDRRLRRGRPRGPSALPGAAR